MVDRVYKSEIPALRKKLERLNAAFAESRARTDWANLRVEPLLQHARTLEQRLRSPKFSREVSRLRKGVVMFHSDLVYLRTNVRALEEFLASARLSQGRTRKARPPRQAR